MKPLLSIALALCCAGAGAQVYTCPARYPGKDAPAVPLSNATMHIGEIGSQDALHGDIDEVGSGTDTHYHFPEETKRWLVCAYGGRRIDGTAISGARVVGGRHWWIPLDPLIDACDLRIRRVDADSTGSRAWTATATCRRKALPPPVMLE